MAGCYKASGVDASVLLHANQFQDAKICSSCMKELPSAVS